MLTMTYANIDDEFTYLCALFGDLNCTNDKVESFEVFPSKLQEKWVSSNPTTQIKYSHWSKPNPETRYVRQHRQENLQANIVTNCYPSISQPDIKNKRSNGSEAFYLLL